MASVQDSIERYEAENIFAASPSLTVRRMRQSQPELLTRAAKGSGKNAPQAEPLHQTNIILAQGAHLPIDAAAAVMALRNLPATSSETLVGPPERAVPPKGAIMHLPSMTRLLGEVLDDFIHFGADPGQRSALEEVTGHDWALTLCVDGPYATISHRVSADLVTVVFGQRVLTDRVQRLVRLPYRVITIASELWQDTCRRRGQVFPENTGAPARNRRPL